MIPVKQGASKTHLKQHSNSFGVEESQVILSQFLKKPGKLHVSRFSQILGAHCWLPKLPHGFGCSKASSCDFAVGRLPNPERGCEAEPWL
jgi:hypothetical protein